MNFIAMTNDESSKSDRHSSFDLRASSFLRHSSFVIRVSSFLEPLLENPHPVSKKDLFDFFVAEFALDQAPRQAAAMRMLRQFRHEVGVRKLILKCDLLPLRPLPVNEFKEIEPDRDAVDPDQITHVLDVVDVTICRRFYRMRTDQHGVDADDATARADGFDLFVGHVPLDVVIFSRVRVRNDHRLRRHLDDIVESRRADMGEVDDDAELFAFANYVAAEWRQPVTRRTAGGEEPAIARGVTPNMGETERTQPQLVKDAQQIEIGAERLDAFHGEEKRNLVLLAGSQNFLVAPANRAPA